MSKDGDVIDNKDIETGILNIIEMLRNQPGALLPILHNIQSSFGFIPEESIPLIADSLNVSRADVHGVISFYHDFRDTKPGTYMVQICRAESCRAMGAVALEKHVKEILEIDYHETTADGRFSLEPIYCFGNCACSPSIAIADQIYGDMNVEEFDQVFASLSEVPAKVGEM